VRSKDFTLFLFMTVISYPVPLYANLPIEPQYYTPWRFVISAISLGVTTTITMVIPAITDLTYVVGQQVRLIIPPTFGCRQLNGQTAYVIAVNLPDQVVLDINSSQNVDSYIASSQPTPAQILAIGDILAGAINNNGTQNQTNYVIGSFINVSPN
jgi:hypothetical protein